jgi:hypothetical protein
MLSATLLCAALPLGAEYKLDFLILFISSHLVRENLGNNQSDFLKRTPESGMNQIFVFHQSMRLCKQTVRERSGRHGSGN